MNNDLMHESTKVTQTCKGTVYNVSFCCGKCQTVLGQIKQYRWLHRKYMAIWWHEINLHHSSFLNRCSRLL